MTSYPRLLEELHTLRSPSRNYSPLKLLASLALMIFIAEITAMVVLYFIQIPNYVIKTLLDSALMLLLIFPGLYYLHLKPFMKKIEEQEQSEQALRTSEAHLRKILDSMPVGVWIVNKDGDIIYGNQACQAIWAGMHQVGVNGYCDYKAWWAASGEPVQPHEWAASRAINRGETSIEEEIDIEAFDGSRKNMLNSAVPIVDDKNGIVGAVIVNQDITLRRQMEKEKIQASELLKRFFNSIHTLTAYLDCDFNFMRVNQAYADSSGHSIDYFIGKNHFELYPHAENEAIFRQVVETGRPFIVFEKPFEYSEYPDRGVTYWDWSLQPVMGADNKVEGLVLSLLDVTRRKLAELKLERQNKELLELTRTEHKQRVLAEGLVQSVITLNTSLELDEVLCSILEQTRKAIPFRGADIILVEEKTWQVAAYLGFEDYPAVNPDLKKTRTFDGYPFLHQVCSSLQLLILNSVSEQPGWRTDPDMAWVHSFAAIPLIIDGNVMGIIELYSEHDAAFNQDMSERLAAFAAPAALALHNARLYQAESEARQISETLSTAAQALSQTLDLEHVIDALLVHIKKIVDCDTSGVTLMEGEGRWNLRALQGFNAWADRDDIPAFPQDEINVIQSIVMTHKSLIVPNTVSNAAGMQTSPNVIHSWAILPIIANDKVIGFVELGKAGKDIFRREPIQWAETLVLQASVAIQNAWLFEQVRSSSIRLQSLAHKLVEIQEKERYHIARELHDEAGQVLSSLKLSLGRLEQDPDCPAHIRESLIQLKMVADRVLEDLHRLAMDLRPVALDHLGLVPALQQLSNDLNAKGLLVKFKTIGIEGERLPPDMETSLYRIVQEALTNVLNHAHASNVGILLEQSSDKLKLFVEDDGVGFTPDSQMNSERLGLVGMRERAEMLGGSLIIESSATSGTSIIVEVPNADTYSHHG